MTVFTVPRTNLAIGVNNFGPWAVPDGDLSVQMTIDRTITGGMNATPATLVTYSWQISTDGGVTFPYISTDGPFPGGVIPDFDTGLPMAFDGFGVSTPPGTARQARLAVTVSGARVFVAGSVALG